ncbi:protein MULTIPLE CHLOROPLAST DIVISION SITE 1 [Juglans microcarpa x Juglans regia]|uniref:protein MULTIPLE CHLOROPLAST DIVISION SITE 1 n=1 Tax=Juglans microcarpa x Juglans regia TaxID=2249226 RepID=UPI001B7DEBD8|nr:protein MULTIPLE CHLOROPLAST DIVISION SITE 1 [Juglans microcarpa x Juglans regia]
MASTGTLQFHPISFRPVWGSKRSNLVELRADIGLSSGRPSRSRLKIHRKLFILRAVTDSSSCGGEDHSDRDGAVVKSQRIAVIVKDRVTKFQGTISSSPPVVFVMNRYRGSNFAIGLCIVTAFLVIGVRLYATRKSRDSRPGSVADLVRRGQLRSDRRGISRPLKYEDPFNNPLVKVGKGNSTIEVCGKVYRLAPVTLTEEQQAIHQKRRSRAYQWKRPTIFLKEGELVPPDVDPDTIRWIPANHPFATTTSDIDEDLAQNNVYQKHGVPFRIQAEHEALQRKLEALQTEQKFNNLVIDPRNAKDFERPFKDQSRSDEQVEQSSNNQTGDSMPPKANRAPISFESNPSSEETQKL